MGDDVASDAPTESNKLDPSLQPMAQLAHDNALKRAAHQFHELGDPDASAIVESDKDGSKSALAIPKGPPRTPTLEEMKAQIRAQRAPSTTCRPGAMVYVARHGEPLVGRGGKESRLEDDLQIAVAAEWAKTTKMPQNPPLSRRGRQQGLELGQALIGKGVSHVYCSPFLRCVQTAEAVAEVLNCPFRVEMGLCEWLIKPWYPSDPRPQMCGESIFEVYPTCDGSYNSLVKEVDYPEEDDKMRARLDASMKHLVGDGHGAAGLNFGSILVIAHASGIEALCKALVPSASILPTPFCSLTAMEKTAYGTWMMSDGALNIQGPTYDRLQRVLTQDPTLRLYGEIEHDYLSQGHTLSEFKPSFVPLPGTKPTSGLAAMDADGDGTLDRSEWMKMVS
jgi:broad specificity phosphatase PhoE